MQLRVWDLPVDGAGGGVPPAGRDQLRLALTWTTVRPRPTRSRSIATCRVA